MEPDKSKSPLSPQYIEQQETNPNFAVPPTQTTVQQLPDSNLYPKKRSKILTTNYILASIVGLALLSGFISSSPGYVTITIYVVLFVGVVFAIMLGVHSAQEVARGIRYREHYGGHASKLFISGYILTIISFFTGGITLIPGLILLYIGSNRNKNIQPTGEGKHTNGFLKVLYIGLGFIGGALPALMVTCFGAFMLWDHWCNLTSSKCL